MRKEGRREEGKQEECDGPESIPDKGVSTDSKLKCPEESGRPFMNGVDWEGRVGEKPIDH